MRPASRCALSDLAAAKLGLRAGLGELRTRYQAAQEPAAMHLSWRDVAGEAHIGTRDDLDAVLSRIRSKVQAALDDHAVVIIE